MKRPTGAQAYARRTLWLAVFIGFVLAVTLSAMAALLYGLQMGRDVIGGAAIALLPQVWFVATSLRRGAGQAAATLAASKYALSATGFAVWFALLPDANLVATLVGTITTVLVVVGATHRLSHLKQHS